MLHKELWNKTHSHLQMLMKEEISSMREILANMHQEELILMINDRACLVQIMHERSQLLGNLKDLRLERLNTTEKLKKLAQIDNEGASLETILALDSVYACETFSLRDQMLALVERMNLQHSRNTLLADYPPHRWNVMGQFNKGQVAVAHRTKKRVSIVIDPEDVEM